PRPGVLDLGYARSDTGWRAARREPRRGSPQRAAASRAGSGHGAGALGRDGGGAVDRAPRPRPPGAGGDGPAVPRGRVLDRRLRPLAEPAVPPHAGGDVVREFGKGGFSLRHAPAPLRLVYAGFLALLAPGVLSQLAFHVGRIGLTPTAVATYYRGGEQGEVMAFPKPAGQLLELTHAHAFTMSVVFLILAHLFVSTSVSDRFKVSAL